MRVVVLDRQRTFADALAGRLNREDDLVATGATVSPSAGQAMIVTQGADIVLLDGDLPGDDAISLCAQLSGRSHPPHVIMLSETAPPQRIIQAIRAGAAAWLNKDETLGHLLRVLRGVAHGDMWLPPAILRAVIRLLLSENDEQHDCDSALATLTPREQEVLERLVAGAGRRAVAEQMHVSGNTVRTHLQNLMGKLGVHSTLEAVVVARSRQGQGALAPAAPRPGEPSARSGPAGSESAP